MLCGVSLEVRHISVWLRASQEVGLDMMADTTNMLSLIIPRNPIKLLLMLISLLSHWKIRMMQV